MGKIKLTFIGCFVFCFFYLQGQEHSFFVLSSENLDRRDARKVERVERLLDKARGYLEEAKTAQGKLEDYREADRDNLMRHIALKERVNRLYIKAYSYVGDAHKIQFDILKKLLREKELSDSTGIEERWTEQFRRATVLRRKGSMMVGEINPKSLLAEATHKEVDVLEKMETLVKAEVFFDGPNLSQNLSSSDTSANKGQPQGADIEQDRVVDVPAAEFEVSVDSSIAALDEREEKISQVKPEQKNPVEPTDKRETAEKSADLFYSIQFMAVRSAATENEIRDVYGGPLPVIKNRSDGWYRYSAGKFDTLEEAMKQKGIYGFVVAFRNDERISISQAKQLIERK